MKELDSELKSDAAYFACYELVNYGSYNHFEALGILMEVLHEYRNTSIKILKEESGGCTCDEHGCDTNDANDDSGLNFNTGGN